MCIAEYSARLLNSLSALSVIVIIIIFDPQ